MRNDPLVDSIDLSSRRKRRAAVSTAISLLRSVHSAERRIIDREPASLLSGVAYENATRDAGKLSIALDVLGGAYSQRPSAVNRGRSGQVPF